MGGHLWRKDWDPEGLLSTLPAIATTLLGVLAGLTVRDAASPRALVRRLSLWGLAGVLAGLACNLAFPINKSLWTSSYVLFTAGVASAVLAACYAWVDASPSPATRHWSEPFVALGRNALLLFVASGVLAKILIYLKWPDPNRPLGSWLYAVAFVHYAPPKIASLLFALTHLRCCGRGSGGCTGRSGIGQRESARVTCASSGVFPPTRGFPPRTSPSLRRAGRRGRDRRPGGPLRRASIDPVRLQLARPGLEVRQLSRSRLTVTPR